MDGQTDKAPDLLKKVAMKKSNVANWADMPSDIMALILKAAATANSETISKLATKTKLRTERKELAEMNEKNGETEIDMDALLPLACICKVSHFSLVLFFSVRCILISLII